MDTRAPPSAHVPMLTFMLAALAIVGGLAATLLWLQQPYVLQVAEVEYRSPPTPPLVLPTSNALAVELAARSTAAADKANAELGLQRPQVARNDQPEPVAKPEPAKPNVAKAKPKPKQVARKQTPAPAVNERRPWQQDQRAFGAFWYGGPRSFFN